MRTAKTLIRLGGCPGWSESSLGAYAILLVLSRSGSNFVVVPKCFIFSEIFVHEVRSKNQCFRIQRHFYNLDVDIICSLQHTVYHVIYRTYLAVDLWKIRLKKNVTEKIHVDKITAIVSFSVARLRLIVDGIGTYFVQLPFPHIYFIE